MKIKQILSQSRRDLEVIYECESCGEEEKGTGYDDDYFHRHVIPNKECKKCGKRSPVDYRPMGTKYAEGVVV